MSARLLSYQAGVDGTYAVAVTVTKNYTTGLTSIGGANVATVDEPNIAAAIVTLSSQTPGGNIITEITTPGGCIVKWNETTQEVKVSALGFWPEALGLAYADVVDNGLDG